MLSSAHGGPLHLPLPAEHSPTVSPSVQAAFPRGANSQNLWAPHGAHGRAGALTSGWLAGCFHCTASFGPHSGSQGCPARGAQCRVPSYTRGQAVPPALGLGVSAQPPSSAPPGLLPPGATSRPRPLPSVLHGLSLVPTGSRRPLLSVCLAPVPPGSPCSVQLRRSPPPPWPRPVSAFVRAAPPPGTLTCPCGCHSEAPGQGAYRGGGLEAG